MAVITRTHLAAYVLHCSLYAALIVIAYYLIVVVPSNDLQDDIEYSQSFNIFVLGIRLLIMLVFPRLLMTLIGLFYFVKCYDHYVPLKVPLVTSPFICFRVVTRGDYPDLVKENLKQNMLTCLTDNLENFVIEVVTDVALDLPKDIRVRETVVPTTYVPRSGVKYKGRALQYCLEDGVNQLKDEDWIVHLDEETLLTENSVKGIINFVSDGRHPFGQGLVTYNNNPVNKLLTLMDSIRISEDLGLVRGSFKLFHKPLFHWRGSFCVCKVGPEKHVSWDHGPAGSLTEDIVFAKIAFTFGYTFNYVDGEMLEKSPFTVKDYIKQRKRWIEGMWQTVCYSNIPLRYKIFNIFDMGAIATTPILLIFALVEFTYRLPRFYWLSVMTSVALGSTLFVFIFGIIKSYTLTDKRGRSKLVFQLLTGVSVALPLQFLFAAISFVWFLIGQKQTFYIVQKWDDKLMKMKAEEEKMVLGLKYV